MIFLLIFRFGYFCTSFFSPYHSFNALHSNQIIASKLKWNEWMGGILCKELCWLSLWMYKWFSKYCVERATKCDDKEPYNGWIKLVKRIFNRISWHRKCNYKGIVKLNHSVSFFSASVPSFSPFSIAFFILCLIILTHHLEDAVSRSNFHWNNSRKLLHFHMFVRCLQTIQRKSIYCGRKVAKRTISIKDRHKR